MQNPSLIEQVNLLTEAVLALREQVLQAVDVAPMPADDTLVGVEYVMKKFRRPRSAVERGRGIFARLEVKHHHPRQFAKLDVDRLHREIVQPPAKKTAARAILRRNKETR